MLEMLGLGVAMLSLSAFVEYGLKFLTLFVKMDN